MLLENQNVGLCQHTLCTTIIRVELNRRKCAEKTKTVEPRYQTDYWQVFWGRDEPVAVYTVHGFQASTKQSGQG